MAEVKVTKAMVLQTIIATINNGVEIASEEVTTEDVKAFAETMLEQLAVKNERAKERAAQKRAESDELRAVVKSVLTEEFQTGDAILAQIDGEDLTKAKIISRLTDLIKAGEAVKDYVKEDGRKITAYKLA